MNLSLCLLLATAFAKKKSSSSSSSSSSSTPRCHRPRPEVLFSWNFEQITILQPPLNILNTVAPSPAYGPNVWAFFPISQSPLLFTNDGNYARQGSGAYLSSLPFLRALPQTANPRSLGDNGDHTHFGIASSIGATTIPMGEGPFVTTVRLKASTRVYQGQNPFPNDLYAVPEDFRFGCAGMLFLDLSTRLGFGMVQTNNVIYAHVGRQFAGGAVHPLQAIFNAFIPVAHRQPEDVDALEMQFDRQAKTVKFIVNGKVVYTERHVGFRPDSRFVTLDEGGVDSAAWPAALGPSIGTFNFLTNQATCEGALYNDCRHKCKLPERDIALIRPYLPDAPMPTVNARNRSQALQYYDNNALVSNRLYGQGVIMYAESLEIRQRAL